MTPGAYYAILAVLSILSGGGGEVRARRSTEIKYKEKDIASYHFHIYYIEDNPRNVKEAMDFRKATREAIANGHLRQCSLNQVFRGGFGPHIISQYELCCNRSSFAHATAWHMQNHGNLTVFIHPLTVYSRDDHLHKGMWLGTSMPLDGEYPMLFPLLPRAHICPIYPKYSDTMPKEKGHDYPKYYGSEFSEYSAEISAIETAAAQHTGNNNNNN